MAWRSILILILLIAIGCASCTLGEVIDIMKPDIHVEVDCRRCDCDEPDECNPKEEELMD